MSETTDIFDDMFKAMTEAHCDVRKGRVVVTDCLAGSIGQDHQMTELGMYQGVELQIHIKTADLPTRGIAIGDVLDVRQPATSGEWQAFRVAGRTVTGGVVTLEMAAKHE